jgi:hypothetical protein
MALIAILALIAGIVSDSVGSDFWERHALLAGVAGSLLVVMLSVAVINEALELRQRRRWTVLAQYVMLKLARNARVIWTGVTELAGLMPSGATTTAALEAGARLVRDTPGLTAAVQELVADPNRRRQLQEGIGRFMTASDELLGRWAAVMLSADAYAEIIDRHVELALDVAWLDSLLDSSDPAPSTEPGRRDGRSKRVVPIEDEVEDEDMVNRVVAIAQFAENLDQLTLKIAVHIVPVQWWNERLGTVPPARAADPDEGRARPAAS